jgi:hypothetical protein
MIIRPGYKDEGKEDSFIDHVMNNCLNTKTNFIYLIFNIILKT